MYLTEQVRNKRYCYYDVDVQYQQGTTMHFADPLSQASLPLRRTRTETRTEFPCAVEFAAISQPQLQEPEEHTNKDPTGAMLRDAIKHGWPGKKSGQPAEVQPYFHIRDEPSVGNDIILFVCLFIGV